MIQDLDGCLLTRTAPAAEVNRSGIGRTGFEPRGWPWLATESNTLIYEEERCISSHGVEVAPAYVDAGDLTSALVRTGFE
jgi:hypothetical protein